jgi:hypothetical protein
MSNLLKNILTFAIFIACIGNGHSTMSIEYVRKFDAAAIRQITTIGRDLAALAFPDIREVTITTKDMVGTAKEARERLQGLCNGVTIVRVVGDGITDTKLHRLSRATAGAGVKILDLSKCSKTKIPGKAFYGRSLVCVNAPNVVEISSQAFCDCAHLKDVYIPRAQRIGASAFGYCRNLSFVDARGAITIDHDAFRDCPSLTLFDASRVTTIGHGAFFGDKMLREVNLLDVEDVGSDAFHKCESLSSVNFPRATRIERNAFHLCSALETARVPEAVDICFDAFFACKNLTSVTLPTNIKSFRSLFGPTKGYSQFPGCYKLSTLHFVHIGGQMQYVNLMLVLPYDEPTFGGARCENMWRQIKSVDLKTPNGDPLTDEALTVFNCGADGVTVVLDRTNNWKWEAPKKG